MSDAWWLRRPAWAAPFVLAVTGSWLGPRGRGVACRQDGRRLRRARRLAGPAVVQGAVGGFQELDDLEADAPVALRPLAGPDAVQEVLALRPQRLLERDVRDR